MSTKNSYFYYGKIRNQMKDANQMRLQQTNKKKHTQTSVVILFVCVNARLLSFAAAKVIEIMFWNVNVNREKKNEK